MKDSKRVEKFVKFLLANWRNGDISVRTETEKLIREIREEACKKASKCQCGHGENFGECYCGGCCGDSIADAIRRLGI